MPVHACACLQSARNHNTYTIMRASGILHELVATNALALRALLGGPGGSQLCKFFLSA